jgi:putative hydrolase of the HAD superfamily
MSPGVKAIFFDLGETLVTQNIEDNMVTKNALKEIALILPRTRSGRDLYKIYQEGYKVNNAIRSRHNVEITVQTWMRQLLTRALATEPLQKLTDEAIRIIVKNRAANALAFQDARPALEKLSERSVKLGIISNVSSHEVALQILKNVKLYKYFDQVITSAHTGIRKPDPGIFLYALLQFGLGPEEAVHVGDSEHHDVEGAMPVGMKTVLVSRKPGRTETIADYHFRNLAEAAELLASLKGRGKEANGIEVARQSPGSSRREGRETSRTSGAP